MTLTDDLTRTVALLGDGYRIDTIARAKRAQEINEAMPTTRHDPVAEPIMRRPRRSAMFGRQIPVLHVEAAPDPVVDEAAEFCAVADVPTCARVVGAEAYRRQVDAMALDPAHGIAQADAMRDARRRRAHEIAWQTVKDIDGPLMPATIARLVIEALERDGVL